VAAMNRVSILMYHQVGRFAPMRAHRANYCDQSRFARQMALLAALGCRVLSLEQTVAGLCGVTPLPPRALSLTFDDGYAEFMTAALPTLQRYGFTATVYVIAGWLGRRMIWRGPDPRRLRPRLLNATQLRALHAAGIAIGSHTSSHRPLATLAPAEQREELSASRARLEDLLGAPVLHLCYPFGSFDARTLALAAEVGYRSAVTCLQGAATPADHPLCLPRKAISFGDTLPGYAWKLLVKHAPTPALRTWRVHAALPAAGGGLRP